MSPPPNRKQQPVHHLYAPAKRLHRPRLAGVDLLIPHLTAAFRQARFTHRWKFESEQLKWLNTTLSTTFAAADLCPFSTFNIIKQKNFKANK